jgi:serine/threonine protein kinase
MKVPNSSNPSSYLKDFSPVFIDLLQKILLFNPKKRITIDEILEHEIVREFHKPEQEISCDK